MSVFSDSESVSSSLTAREKKAAWGKEIMTCSIGNCRSRFQKSNRALHEKQVHNITADQIKERVRQERANRYPRNTQQEGTSQVGDDVSTGRRGTLRFEFDIDAQNEPKTEVPQAEQQASSAEQPQRLSQLCPEPKADLNQMQNLSAEMKKVQHILKQIA
jgi:hypothetical protein